MRELKFLNIKSKYIYIGLSTIALLCIAFMIPCVQGGIIRIAEFLIHRQLRDYGKWHHLLFKYAVCLLAVDAIVFFVCLDPNSFFSKIIPIHKEEILCVAIPICVFAYLFLPFILFGKNSVVTIWDHLDSNQAWFKLIRDNRYLFKLNIPSNQMGSLSTIYFGGTFDLYMLIYYLFPDFVAQVLNSMIARLLAFFSTYYLLNLLFGKHHKIINVVIAVSYASLSCFPGYAYSVATVPLVILLFYYISTRFRKIYVLFAFLYPLVCSFAGTGIFICGFWLLAFLVMSVWKKRFQWNLFICLILMCIGFVCVNLRLFCMRFIVHEVLNRDFLSTYTNSFFDSFKRSILYDYDHAYALHHKYILPTVMCIYIYCVFVFVWDKLKNDVKYKDKNISIKNIMFFTIFNVLLFFILFFTLIVSLDKAGHIYAVLSKICPSLAGLSFARVYIFNIGLLYVAFTAAVILLFELSKSTKFVSVLLVGLQLHLILTANVPYNDSLASWKRNLTTNGKENYITYREFYSERQFDEIKQYINYNGENVAAYGYHPSVLMYNGFNCIDGYISVYPYKDMQKFRTLIAPTLDKNEEAKQYYDSWGGRRYLYSIFDIKKESTSIFSPTREKHIEPIPLYIDPDIFKIDYAGKYILSSYPISNAEDMNLQLVKSFDSADSIYIIYVYEMM